MNDYRKDEIAKVIDSYMEEMDHLQKIKIEVALRERQAWQQLQNVMFADNPEKMSNYFRNDK